MRFLVVAFNYITWHYGRAILEFSHIYKNILSFLLNFFSIPILVRSYFAPWRRMGEDYTKNIVEDFGNVASVFVVNFIMRLVGMVMRTIIIIFGLSVVILVALFYPVLLLVWLLLPLIIIFLILLGVGLIIR